MQFFVPPSCAYGQEKGHKIEANLSRLKLEINHVLVSLWLRFVAFKTIGGKQESSGQMANSKLVETDANIGRKLTSALS